MLGLRLRIPELKHAAEKGWYFAFFSSLSLIIPYLNLYFRRQGYGEDIIGFLAGLRPWVSAFFGPLWAAFSDKTRKHRIVLMSTLILSAICRSLIGTTRFLGLLIPYVILGEMFGSPVSALSDAAVLALCAEDGSYGRQRLWGAVGWGICSALSGVLVTKFGLSITFVTSLLMSVMALAFASKLDMSALTSFETEPQKAKSAIELVNRREDDEVPDEENVSLISTKQENKLPEKISDISDVHSKTMKEKLLNLLTKEVGVFLLMAFFMGVGSGTIENFLFLYLDELGAPEVLMGLSLTVTCSAEVPFFFFMDKILNALGTLGTLHMVMFVFSFRLMCYPMLSWLGSPWWVLLVEPLHSITFACAWGAGTEHCRRIAPPGLDATLQSIFSGLYFGYGYGSGALLGGLLYSQFGARVMFGSVSGILGIAWIFCMVSTCGSRVNSEQHI